MKELNEISEVIGALEKMGVEGYCQFYSAVGDDYTEKLVEGMAIMKGNTQQRGASKFSISSYPVWNGPNMDHVYCYGSFTMQDNKIKIDHLSLKFKMPDSTVPYHQIELLEPTAKELPTAQELRNKLKVRNNRPNKRHGIKR